MDPSSELSDVAIAARHAAVTHSHTFHNIRKTLPLGQSRVLDIGCGYGEYLALFGKGSVGITTTSDEVAYGARHGLSIREGNAETLDTFPLEEPFEYVWANNLFEHLVAPHAFLMSIKRLLTHTGRLILGVPVVPAIPTLMRERHFRGALASNHINFFTKDTLCLTVERAGWVVEDVRPFYAQAPLVDRLASRIAPHLYVVARNDPTFSYPPKKVREWQDEVHYAGLLVQGTPRSAL